MFCTQIDMNMMNWCAGILLFAGMIGAISSEAYADPNTSEDPETIYPASDCAVLFGRQDDFRENRWARETSIDFIQAYTELPNPRIYVGHYGVYSDPPERLAPRDLRLVTVESGGALVRVNSDRFGCPTGLYRVGVDYDFGADGHVLAMFENLVLLEYDGQLMYLTNSPGVGPIWSMVWVSPWSIRYPVASSGRSGRSPPRAKKPKSRRRK